MKQVLFLFLIFPIFSEAQRVGWDVAYEKSIPAGLGKPVHLPERDYNPKFSMYENHDYRQKSKIYIVTTDSIYRKLFWRYVYTKDSLSKFKRSGENEFYYNWMLSHLVDSLPIIDFSKYELILYAACAQCFANCGHEKGSNSCHRNACDFRETFFMREKINWTTH